MKFNLRPDLKKHLVVGAGIGFLTGMVVAFGGSFVDAKDKMLPIVIAATILGGLVARFAGVLKEKYDAKHPTTNTVDPLDIKWTMFGGAPGGFAGGVVGALAFL